MGTNWNGGNSISIYEKTFLLWGCPDGISILGHIQNLASHNPEQHGLAVPPLSRWVRQYPEVPSGVNDSKINLKVFVIYWRVYFLSIYLTGIWHVASIRKSNTVPVEFGKEILRKIYSLLIRKTEKKNEVKLKTDTG